MLHIERDLQSRGRDAYICEEEAALSFSEIQHSSEPDSQQLRLLSHVAPRNRRERLHHITP